MASTSPKLARFISFEAFKFLFLICLTFSMISIQHPFCIFKLLLMAMPHQQKSAPAEVTTLKNANFDRILPTL